MRLVEGYDKKLRSAKTEGEFLHVYGTAHLDFMRGKLTEQEWKRLVAIWRSSPLTD